MATEVEQLYLQLELISIEEQMLKLQMLKAGDREDLRGGGLYNTGCEFTEQLWL